MADPHQPPSDETSPAIAEPTTDPSAASTAQGPAASGRAPGPQAAAAPPNGAAAPLRPAEAFVRGLDMLFQAARGTAKAVQTHAEKAGVPQAMQEAGRQLEGVAGNALRGLEQFVRTLGRPSAVADAKPQDGPSAQSPAGPAAPTASPSDDAQSKGS